MKHFSFIVLVFFFASCNTSATKENALQGEVTDTVTIKLTGAEEDEIEPVDTTDYDHATYFVIVADTGLNYFPLQNDRFPPTEKHRPRQCLQLPNFLGREVGRRDYN